MMQDPLIHAPSDLPVAQTSSRLKHLVQLHPYISTLGIFVYFLVCFFSVRPVLGPLIANMHLPFLPHTLVGEVLLALIVAVPIVVLGWWSETGFTRGINGSGIVVCLMPIVLVVLPVFLGLPTVLGSVSLSMFVLAAILVLFIGFAEEGLCRGLLLRSLLPRGIWTSVLLSSVLFAGLHLTNILVGFSWSYVAGQLLIAFGSGVLFAAVRLRTRSIWPSLVLHAAHDFPGILLLAIEPNLALAVPLNLALLVNGTFCAFFLLNAIFLLRPTQIHKMRVAYGLAPAPAIQPIGQSYPTLPYPGYALNQSPNAPDPPPPSEYVQPPMVLPQPFSGDEKYPPSL